MSAIEDLAAEYGAGAEVMITRGTKSTWLTLGEFIVTLKKHRF